MSFIQAGQRTVDGSEAADVQKIGLTALIRDIRVIRGSSEAFAASWPLAVEAFAAEAGITGETPVQRWVWSVMPDLRGGPFVVNNMPDSPCGLATPVDTRRCRRV